MTLIFDSIVKSENSLPKSPEISPCFTLVPHQSLSWQGVNRSAIPSERKGVFQIKGKRRVATGKVVVAINDNNRDARVLSIPIKETF